jgi:hypothetical protein
LAVWPTAAREAAADGRAVLVVGGAK